MKVEDISNDDALNQGSSKARGAKKSKRNKKGRNKMSALAGTADAKSDNTNPGFKPSATSSIKGAKSDNGGVGNNNDLILDDIERHNGAPIEPSSIQRKKDKARSTQKNSRSNSYQTSDEEDQQMDKVLHVLDSVNAQDGPTNN
mgnify:CR=1 FL=1